MKKSILPDIFILSAAACLVFGIRVARGTPPAVQLEPWKVRGNPSAKVFIVEFSDFACPYCDKIRPVLQQVLDAYPNDLKLMFKHFPLSIHPPAEPAAEAAECAADQGKFWEYHDYLFNNVPDWFSAKDLSKKFTSYAGHLGLEMVAFRLCFESGVKKSIVERNKIEGRHLFVRGTPTCILNEKKVLTSNKPEDIKKLVQAEIEKVNHP